MNTKVIQDKEIYEKRCSIATKVLNKMEDAQDNYVMATWFDDNVKAADYRNSFGNWLFISQDLKKIWILEDILLTEKKAINNEIRDLEILLRRTRDHKERVELLNKMGDLVEVAKEYD